MSKHDRDMINAIHRKRAVDAKVESEMEIFKEMLPAIRQMVKSGGNAEAMMKKSGVMAAFKMIKLLNSDKEEIAFKASEKILSYDLGKPVERSVNIYGDIGKMNERDVDQQIINLLQKTGAKKLLETTLDIKPTRKRLQKRKPRKTEDFVVEGNARPIEGPVSPAEAGPTPAAEDQGTS